MEYRISKRMDLITAPRTGVTLASLYTIEPRLMALRTFILLTVLLVEYIVQASIIIGEITIEIFYGIFHHRNNIDYLLLVVKGYLRNIII